MSDVVFDSSTVLAWLNKEAGADLILGLIPKAILSTVNASEAQSKLVKNGAKPKVAWESIVASVREIVPFDQDHAEIAGSLIPHTEPYGLSLGDRACLALGLATNCPVYTADRAWAQVQVGVAIHLVR